MCECNSNIRSPWCGVGDCQMPKQTTFKSVSTNGSFDLVDEIRKLKQDNEYLSQSITLRECNLAIKNDLLNTEIEKLKQTNKQLFRALETLVNLKIHKETYGKNEYYDAHRELAWDEAKTLIKMKEEE